MEIAVLLLAMAVIGGFGLLLAADCLLSFMFIMLVTAAVIMVMAMLRAGPVYWFWHAARTSTRQGATALLASPRMARPFTYPLTALDPCGAGMPQTLI